MSVNYRSVSEGLVSHAAMSTALDAKFEVLYGAKAKQREVRLEKFKDLFKQAIPSKIESQSNKESGEPERSSPENVIENSDPPKISKMTGLNTVQKTNKAFEVFNKYNDTSSKRIDASSDKLKEFNHHFNEIMYNYDADCIK